MFHCAGYICRSECLTAALESMQIVSTQIKNESNSKKEDGFHFRKHPWRIIATNRAISQQPNLLLESSLFRLNGQYFPIYAFSFWEACDGVGSVKRYIYPASPMVGKFFIMQLIQVFAKIRFVPFYEAPIPRRRTYRTRIDFVIVTSPNHH